MRPTTPLPVLFVFGLALVFAPSVYAEEADPVSLEPYVASAEEVKPHGYEVILPGDPRFLAHTLGHFGMKPLAEEPLAAGEERFRFLWLRSFHRAALLELRFTADGTGAYEAKLWEDTPDGGHWVVQRTVALSASDRAGHRKSLERLSFFTLPFDDGRQGLDGATWLFEARDSERSHAVHRWSPEPGALRQFGVSLIETAIPNEFLPIY
ncbi:MAG TPA: hypothetical protein VK163_14740 [Opitutaceae bacterium]|nr:hypothetical protein [Opitutaceae bacterium]